MKAANRNLLGERSFFGGLVGTRGRRGATVPPINFEKDFLKFISEIDYLNNFFLFFILQECDLGLKRALKIS